MNYLILYKTFLNNDVVSTRTLLHEAIPITGTIISGTYSDNNIKNYAHGMFQSVYDYPYLSSSANHIFDITVGISPNSSLSSSANQQNSKKINLYNQMAQVLVGNDITGSILGKWVGMKLGNPRNQIWKSLFQKTSKRKKDGVTVCS